MKVLTVLGSIVGFGFLLVLSTIFSGIVLSVLWGWFVVPIFAAPALGLVPAIGITMVVTYLTHQISHYELDQDFGKTIVRDVIVAFVKPSVALIFGWIMHFFM